MQRDPGSLAFTEQNNFDNRIHEDGIRISDNGDAEEDDDLVGEMPGEFDKLN